MTIAHPYGAAYSNPMRCMVLAIPALLACSGSTNNSAVEPSGVSRGVAAEPLTRTSPAPGEPTQFGGESGYAVKMLAPGQCPSRPEKSFKRSDMSQEAFCSRMAGAIALCEAPYDGISCERVTWEERRRAELESECMSERLDPAAIPRWNDSLFLCAYGDEYPHEYLNFPCRHRMSCWRANGITWKPRPTKTAER